jgi:hypothetical protein
MDNISSAHIHSQVNRMQQEGGKAAAQLYGAAASGKADEESGKADEREQLLEEKAAQGKVTQAEMEVSGENEEVPEQFESSAVEAAVLPGAEDILEKGAGLSAESMESARELVESQIQDNKASEELASPNQTEEPKSMDLRLAENIAVMDIHDLMSGKPLPPILDDPYDIHMENT